MTGMNVKEDHLSFEEIQYEEKFMCVGRSWTESESRACVKMFFVLVPCLTVVFSLVSRLLVRTCTVLVISYLTSLAQEERDSHTIRSHLYFWPLTTYDCCDCSVFSRNVFSVFAHICIDVPLWLLFFGEHIRIVLAPCWGSRPLGLSVPPLAVRYR